MSDFRIPPAPSLHRRPHPALVRLTPYLALEVARGLRSAAERELREYGLHWSGFLVATVVAAIGDMSQQAVADRTGLDRSSVSRIVRELEEEGWLLGSRDPLDARRIRCRPTAGVAEATASATEAIERAVRRTALQRLRAREHERLRVLLGRAIGAPEPQEGQPG